MESIRDIYRELTALEMHKIWQHAKTDELYLLSEEEQQLGRIMLEHEEYHNQFEFADVLEGHPSSLEGEMANPYSHIIIHAIVENQLKLKEPIEAYQFYNSMRRKKASRHNIIHLIASIFIPFVFYALKQKQPLDIDLYRQFLKKYMNMKPEKIYSALDGDLAFIFE